MSVRLQGVRAIVRLSSWCCLAAFGLGAPRAHAEPPEPSLEWTKSKKNGDLELTLGVRGERGRERRELSGYLALSVPLDRLAAPKASLPASGVLPEEADATPDERARSRHTLEPAVPLLAARELSLLARETVLAALRVQAHPESRADLESLTARSRSSALLPELRLRAARAQDESLRLTPTEDDPYRFTQDGGDDLVLEARATWKLDRLVFADEEIAIARLALERDKNGERASSRVVALVLAWHEAVSAARSGDVSARTRAEFERLAAEVTLDVATGGWFGRQATKLLRARVTPPPARPPPSAAPAETPAAGAGEPAPAGPDLVEPTRSATPAESCLPMHVTASRTFKGASMR